MAQGHRTDVDGHCKAHCELTSAALEQEALARHQTAMTASRTHGEEMSTRFDLYQQPQAMNHVDDFVSSGET